MFACQASSTHAWVPNVVHEITVYTTALVLQRVSPEAMQTHVFAHGAPTSA
jgi:hypothetical protein